MATPAATEAELVCMRDKIEQMNKHNQLEVLKILAEYKTELDLNENSNGTYINLFDAKKEIIERLHNYVKFVESQEKYLNDMEHQKEAYKKLLEPVVKK